MRLLKEGDQYSSFFIKQPLYYIVGKISFHKNYWYKDSGNNIRKNTYKKKYFL